MANYLAGTESAMNELERRRHRRPGRLKKGAGNHLHVIDDQQRAHDYGVVPSHLDPRARTRAKSLNLSAQTLDVGKAGWQIGGDVDLAWHRGVSHAGYAASVLNKEDLDNYAWARQGILNR